MEKNEKTDIVYLFTDSAVFQFERSKKKWNLFNGCQMTDNLVMSVQSPASSNNGSTDRLWVVPNIYKGTVQEYDSNSFFVPPLGSWEMSDFEYFKGLFTRLF